MTPTLDEQIAAVHEFTISINARYYPRVMMAVEETMKRHKQALAALRYAISVIETEYKTDPTLQDLARSMRAALPGNNNEKTK